MYGAKHLYHTNLCFQQLHVLKFIEIIEMKTLLFMYKTYQGCLPSNIQRLFVRRETTYSLRASHDLERLRVRSTMRSTHVCIYGVRLGDSQSADIKNINNIIAFKPKQANFYFINMLLWKHNY